MSFPAYANYKDSGVAWLGAVPRHWELVPLKHLGEFNAGAGFPHDEQGMGGEELTFYKVKALGKADAMGILGDSEDTISLDTATKLRAFIFPAKTIAFAKIGAALLLGRLRVTDRPACFDNNMMGFKVADGELTEFAKLAMSLIRFDYIANLGTVPSLNEGQIANIPIPRPPYPEQAAIVTFLNRETAKIDTLVSEQERLIALLKEKRQAVISHAVTKGLNPNAPLKDSGIEWLGDIPAHWDTLPLRAVATDAGNVFIDGDWIESKDISADGIRYITTGNVGEGIYKEQGSGFITEETFEKLNCTEVLPGDVLISRLNLPIGRACIAPDLGFRIVTSVDNVIVRPADKVVRLYLVHLLSAKSFFAHTEMLARGTTMQRISRTILGNVRICLPPVEEQSQISKELEKQTAELDQLFGVAQSAILLLQERRAALISAAVTGKIDVRGLVEPVRDLELA